MITIGEIMNKKPITISPDASVKQASEIMEKFKFGGLPVVDEEKIVGIITSRDIRDCHPNRLVADAMTKKVLALLPETSLWEAKEFIENNHIEHLIVANETKLSGLLTKSLLYMEFGKQIDTLTGFYRSDFLYHVASKLINNGYEIVIIFIDLNNFGVIDKEMGHVTGDLILKQVASLFNKTIDNKTDYLCRYAGDEFAIITIRPLKEAKKLGFFLLDSLTNQQWPNGINLSASIGISGGRRISSRPGNEWYAVSKLINLASLGSTKAKKDNTRLVIVGQVKIIEDKI